MTGPTSLADQIEEIRDDVSALKADVSALKADMAVVKPDVAALKADMAVVKPDVAALKSDVEEVRGLRKEFIEFRAEVQTQFRVASWAGLVLGGLLLAAVLVGVWLGSRFSDLPNQLTRLELRMDRELGEIKALIRDPKVAAGARSASPD